MKYYLYIIINMRKNSVWLIWNWNMWVWIGYNLLKNDKELFVLDWHSQDNTNYLKENGASILSSIEEICRKSEYIILCLPSSKEVEAVCLDIKWLLSHVLYDTKIIDCTSSKPDSTIHLSQEFFKKWAIFIDAPLTRTPVEAMKWKLNCILWCKMDEYPMIVDLLKKFCENIFYAWKVGNANTIKLINNAFTLMNTAIIWEIIKKTLEMDIDLHNLKEVVSSWWANSPQFQWFMDWLMNGNKDALKFSLKNAKKDLVYLSELIQNKSSSLNILDSIIGLYDASIEEFWPNSTLPYLCWKKPGHLDSKK